MILARKPYVVMPGLVPGIHAFLTMPAGEAWMAAALASDASGQRGNSRVRAADTRPEPGSSARATSPGMTLCSVGVLR